MRRFLAITAVSAAAACAFSLNANAAAKAPIRTYTKQASMSFTSIGAFKGDYSKVRDREKVMLSPRLGMASTTSTSVLAGGKVFNHSIRFDIVGNHTYSKQDNGRWVTSVLTAKDRASAARAFDPYATLGRFGRLPGVRQVSRGHFSVTGPAAKISPFVRYEFGVTQDSFPNTGIRTLTVTMVLDSSGRPVRITASGRSAREVFAATETFALYNKPVTITAP